MSVDVFSSHMQEQEVRLDPKRAAVVVVDMINEFCKPGGNMVLPGYEALLCPQLSVIAAARAAGATIIWIHDSHRPNTRREVVWRKRIPHGVEGTWATEIIADLGARADELHVTKHRYSGFFQTDLDLVLRDMLVDQLIVFGVVTNICVRSTVHDAFFLGYEVVVPRDCCAATGPREQESTLYDIATHFGVVSDSAAVVAGLSGGGTIVNREIAA